MKILLHSNAPWAPTGYGQQTALVVPMLREAGHDAGISCFWGLQGQALENNGVPMYPADDDFGNRWLPAYATHHSKTGDPLEVQIITLMDVWVLTSPLFAELRMASWCPVDHWPLPPNVLRFFEQTHAEPIAMSRFGEQMMLDAGLRALYVPHGIDTSVLVPMDKIETRRWMNAGLPAHEQIPEDAFVVGMVAANKGVQPSRKSFPQVFEAFKRLHAKRPDSILYLHTMKMGDGPSLNLIALAKTTGMPMEALRWTPEFELQMGVPASKMPYVFGSFDILCNPSYGEGFGIPIVEAQSCGVPVITNDCTSMTELTGAGWAVGGEPWYDATQGAYFQTPSIAEITDAMIAAHDMAEVDRTALSIEAREFALGYDARRVFDAYWVPALAELEIRHEARMAERAKANGNRATRRRASRSAAATK